MEYKSKENPGLDSDSDSDIDCEKTPSQEKYSPWLWEKNSKYQHYGCYGKWMLFIHRTRIDAEWEKIKKLYRSGELIGIYSMKVSTSYKNPRSSSSNEHVIICYCGLGSGELDDKENILKYGHNLAKLMNYKNRSKVMCYKTNEQSMMGTIATGNKINSLYKISVPQP